MLSEISQKEKDRHQMISIICNVQKIIEEIVTSIENKYVDSDKKTLVINGGDVDRIRLMYYFICSYI